MKNPFIISLFFHSLCLLLCVKRTQLDTKKSLNEHIKAEQSFDVSLNTPQKSTPQKTIQKSIPQKKTIRTIVKKPIKSITQKPIPKPTLKPTPTHKNHTNHIHHSDNTQFIKLINTPDNSLNQGHSINKPLHTMTQKTIEQPRFNKEDYIADAKRRIAKHKFYPNSAKRRSIEGRVALTIGINPNGTLRFVRITHSSGSKILDDAALNAVHAASPFKILQKTLTFDCAIQFFLEDN